MNRKYKTNLKVHQCFVNSDNLKETLEEIGFDNDWIKIYDDEKIIRELNLDGKQTTIQEDLDLKEGDWDELDLSDEDAEEAINVYETELEYLDECKDNGGNIHDMLHLLQDIFGFGLEQAQEILTLYINTYNNRR